MGNESPLLAFVWTFAVAVAVGAVIAPLLSKRKHWPRTISIALGLAIARAVIVGVNPPFLLEVVIVVVLLGTSTLAAKYLFPLGDQAGESPDT